ncbi:hypothetical protein PIB30_030525 [Stylosanthes scabra]|uniref:Uncharacterized protein n=1 Tax=Stylosanthes scabra TaxID=79078 RepID=A0ABU6ZBQ7_9FABA|nr:hypothetical protein [Stylosanthes scabra]
MSELFGYRATLIRRPFRGWATGEVIRGMGYLASKLQRPLARIQAELRRRSLSPNFAQSAILQKCLDLRGVGL